MAEVYNLENKKISDYNLDEAIFGLEHNEDLIFRVVNWQLSRKRSGTACTKTKGEVRGGGAKPWKQKNLGRARSGSTRSPIWRKGGVVFGPKPKDWSYSLPKKVRRKALKVTLSYISNNGNLKILENLDIQETKTRSIVNILSALELDNTLIVDDENYKNLKLSCRNLNHVKVLKTEGVNVYDILKFKNLVISKNALDKLQEVLKS